VSVCEYAVTAMSEATAVVDAIGEPSSDL